MKLYGFSMLLPKICGGFSKIAKPITTLQRKGVKYEWTEECNKAFSELKRLLTSTPILRVPNMDKDFTVCTDASKQGLGAVLMLSLIHI